MKRKFVALVAIIGIAGIACATLPGCGSGEGGVKTKQVEKRPVSGEQITPPDQRFRNPGQAKTGGG